MNSYTALQSIPGIGPVFAAGIHKTDVATVKEESQVMEQATDAAEAAKQAAANTNANAFGEDAQEAPTEE